MKNFKHFFFTFFIFFISNLFAQNSLKVKDLNVGPGEETKLILELENVTPVSGLQFKIKLPNDLLVKEKESKFVGRNTNHIIYPKNLGNGEFLFLIFSATNDNFIGNLGGLIEIPIEIPLSYLPTQTYSINLSEVVVSNNSGVDVGSNHLNGILNITEGKNPDLKVDNITFSGTSILPNSKFKLSWQVQNIGKSSAKGGWREQISLVSQSNGKKYIIGYASYLGDLVENGFINRTDELDIPPIIGFDGQVKIEVLIVPNASVKEPVNYKHNNVLLSASDIDLLKRLILTVDKREIIENTTDQIRVSLARSGELNTEESFTLSSSINDFNLPVQLKINQNESSTFAFVKPINNNTYEGDRHVEFKVQGNGYNDEIVNVNLLDDEKIILSLSYPSTYESSVGSKIPFTLSANFSKNKDEIIYISTDKSKRLQFPSTVTMPSGQTSITFEGIILDTQTVEKSEIANVFAKATGYTSADKDIKLKSINVPDFTVAFNPAKVSEGDGVRATYLSIKRTSHIDKEVFVSLSVSKEDQLILPVSDILFKKDESEKRIEIGTIDNSTVEGERLITLTSRVKFASCNCIDNSDATTISKADLTIIDNDGLALIVLPSPSTVKAGSLNNTLKISRNTDNPTILANPLTISLSSDLASVINLPSTVYMPSGSKEITVNYSTVIDPNLTGDQSPRVQASSAGYSNGYAWILVSDQNKADVFVENVIAPTNIEAGKHIVKTLIKNQGNAVFHSGAKLDYYISKTNSITNLTPITSSIINKSIAIGQTYEHTEGVQLPNISGDLKLLVLINGDKSISELDYINNQGLASLKILPSYTVTVVTNKNIYKPNEVIQITGSAKNSYNSKMPLVDIELKISNQEFERSFYVKTDVNGDYIYKFQPLQNEAGNYLLAATYPGEVITPQASFQILGFEFVDKPQFIKWEPLVNVPLGKEFKLKNNTQTILTGVKINLPPDADFTIEQTAITINPGQTAVLPYTLKSTVASKETKYYETKFSIVSNEGAELNDIAYYFSKHQEARLEANPVSINTTMIKNQSRLYEFSVKNVGLADAENVEVFLPEMGWLKLNSNSVIPVIKSSEEAKIILELTPSVKEQINVPISGNFVIKQKYGSSLSIPFRVETVSEATGKLIIDATDEYTYNTASAPHLKGAKVVVKHPFTGAVIAEGLTNELGLFEIPSIKEGWYTVNISTDKHTPYQNNIQIDPGRDTKITAFLPYQAVTYSWDVTQIDINDEYDIKLITQFETNVPKPVVVMELDNPKLDLQLGESRMTYVTVTNHGLIAGNKIKIAIGDLDGYTFKPLITSLDVLNAKSTIIIPVLVKNESNIGGRVADSVARMSGGGGGCSVGIALTGYYFCNVEQMFNASVVYFKTGCGEPTKPVGPGGPGGPGGGGVCWGCFPDAFGWANGINMINACDPCPNAVISTLLGCYPPLGVVSCAFGLFTSTSLTDIGAGALACVYFPFSCGSAICNLKNCLPNSSGNSCAKDIVDWATGSSGKIMSKEVLQANSNKTSLDYVFDDLNQIEIASLAHQYLITEYIKNSELEGDRVKLGAFLSAVGLFLDQEKQITASEVTKIKDLLIDASIGNSYIDSFVSRWNTSLIAWSNNVYSPNSSYPSIINKNKIDKYKELKSELKSYAFKRGFVSVEDMYQNAYKSMDEFQKEKAKEGQASVCASVTIEFPQKLTMTREAFEGKLKINNSSDKILKDINLDLIVKNEIGENKTHLFQINKEAFLNGSGLVNPKSNGTGLAIFIPTKEAAPQVKQSYSFGGKLSYFDSEINERVYIDLNPVTLEVNPSPDLVLHYFMQRDILGDDALTEDIVESTIPAELSLMINNEGYGEAKNVAVESMQPKIVDNQKGLLVDFKMIGSNFNNEPKQLGLLNIDFGNVLPKKTAIGQWWFTSSLLGHFIKYDVKVKHTSSFGNANLSLIKAAYIHELIKSVKSYGVGSDAISDFLVNDVADAQDTPDRIYLSDGSSEEVLKAESIEVSNTISSSSFSSKLTLRPLSSAWNYSNILDPGGKQYKLVKVIRDKDNFEIPMENVWQTHVTLKDGLNPKYENKLHIIDKISEVHSYTLYYNPIDGNIPVVEAFIDAPKQSNAFPVELVKVRFNKDIDVNTFTSNNVELIHQGVKLPSNTILIGKIDNRTYSLNIKELTKLSGYYELKVNALGIKDLLGNEGRDGKKINWIQFINELGVLKFESDQIKKQPLNMVIITFNKPIRTEEFTIDKIKIGGNIINDLVIQKIDEYVYTISGLKNHNNSNGSYKLDIDVTKITAVDGTKGLTAQSFEWNVDKELPKIVSLSTNNQGGIHNQHITEIDLVLSEKIINDLDKSLFKFTRNGQLLAIPIMLQKVNDLNYKILGLGEYTKSNGDYRLVFDQTSLIDESNNSGEGLADTSWSVRQTNFAGITGLKIVPDRGVSNTDNITSGNDLELLYTTLQDDLKVEVYELLANSELLLHKDDRLIKGEYRVSLADKVGAKRFKVVGYDKDGNSSNSEVINVFIDFKDIVADIKPVKVSTNICSGFDHIIVNFDEDIKEESFNKESFQLQLSGKVISNTNTNIVKLTDSSYKIEGISYSGPGDLELKVEKYKLFKKITGMNGIGVYSENIGNPNKYSVLIDGENTPIIGNSYSYMASSDMSKYDWIVVNGEILSTNDNVVSVKWNKSGEQYLIVRYQTPLGCTTTADILVNVNDPQLSNGDFDKTKSIIYPVPNNGIFTIQLSKPLMNGTLNIYNLSGQRVYQERNVDFIGNSKEINVVNLLNGIYLIKIDTDDQSSFEFKFVKQ